MPTQVLLGLEALARRLEAIASRLEAIASRLEAQWDLEDGEEGKVLAQKGVYW